MLYAHTGRVSQVVLANQDVLDRIRNDYPAAMDNAVYDYLEDLQVRHWIGGLGIGIFNVNRASGIMPRLRHPVWCFVSCFACTSLPLAREKRFVANIRFNPLAAGETSQPSRYFVPN